MRIPFLGENHSDIGGTKMKRIAAILLAVLALLLGACSVQRYSDAAMFCRRFNREYKESLLDIETATVTETDGCTVFSLTPDENILISLYTDSDGVRIKRISITAHGNVEEMQNGLFARFLAFCKCAKKSFGVIVYLLFIVQLPCQYDRSAFDIDSLGIFVGQVL